ncbi:hypothetical protein MN116_000950 [Schistosoma mekongi]|uniref:BSD domain-containing protein n=1 Tax=Schistosoma mekongi TaxID=38744 RepID=A0AAE1ZKP2_SCHME|nr:hypothetical protein MN116_000950 [Schistosoma mekongi]
MNAIPLADAKSDEYNHLPIEELTQPPHPSPAELLEAYPFMQTYLKQHVHPDGEITDNRSISDSDFWSRYYYHVWLLDSTEFRRRKLNEHVESVSAVKQSTQHQSTWHGMGSNNGTVEDLSFVSQDEWPDTLDSDDQTTMENKQEISNDKLNIKHCNVVNDDDGTVTSSARINSLSGRSSTEDSITTNKSNNGKTSRKKHGFKRSANKNEISKEPNYDNQDELLKNK